MQIQSSQLSCFGAVEGPQGIYTTNKYSEFQKCCDHNVDCNNSVPEVTSNQKKVKCGLMLDLCEGYVLAAMESLGLVGDGRT